MKIPRVRLKLGPGSLLLVVAWAWSFLPAGSEAAVSPAGQAFQQEVASGWFALKAKRTEALVLLDLHPEGGLRASDGKQWFIWAEERLAPLEAQGVFENNGSFILDQQGREVALPVALAEIRHIYRRGDDIWLSTGAGVLRVMAGGRISVEMGGEDVRQVAMTEEGYLLAATAEGLWQLDGTGDWERVRILDRAGRAWGERDIRGVAVDRRHRWWVATPAGVACLEEQEWRFYTGADGLPWADFTGVAVGPGDEIWFGTRHGAIRFDGRDWAYREGPRWLPGNEVRSLAVGQDGRIWLATDGGLGWIERRPMTLAEKAAFYEEEVGRYIKRTPFGYTSEVRLESPGDRSKIIYSDSDNDGLWTAMYGAGQCFAYGATKLPEFKERARQAFEALRFLQKVTQGGAHSPPKGYVARTIRPVDWPDPNIGRREHDQRVQETRDSLWKIYEPRWPLSADGQWFWKSDTSSDELDGHYFFYPLYYDLVAEDEPERERVREVVRDLTDHLMAHGFTLMDHDGRPTRWAIFGPQYLNHDPFWWEERGLNSLSILSYLAVAEHITGDAKYGQAAAALIQEHGYGANVMVPKIQMGIGSGNQSDDEMAFMCFYNLLKYSRDTEWKSHWLKAFYLYHRLEQPEVNPFFNFVYAATALGKEAVSPWGVVPLEPWSGWLEDSMETLRGFPLERVNWPHQNSHRLDLAALPPQQSRSLYLPEQRRRGHRVNGKVLPVEERHFGHWNTDPWQLDYGGDGRELASGTVFLLPYYMGLHYGFIAPPRQKNIED